MSDYQCKAITLLLILFVCFFIAMCRARTSSTQELAYGMLALFSAVLAMGVTKL